MALCYNCGQPIAKEENSKEHIPAQGLYEGFGDEYKVNRITVPAHKKCNGDYNLCDAEFRNLIGIGSNDQEKDSISQKTVSDLLRSKSNSARLHFDDNGSVKAITFNYNHIEEFHQKNFKGLFMHQYRVPISNDYIIKVNFDERDWSKLTLSMIGYLQNNFSWKHSGHPDIFKYILQPHRDVIREGEQDGIKIDNPNSENFFVGLLSYNKHHAALVTAIKKDFLEELRPKATAIEKP